MRVRNIVVVSALAFTAFAVTTPATAQSTKSEARKLFMKGLEKADDEQWSEAVQYFRRSLALVERPSTMFNLGIALYRMGSYRESLAMFDRFMEASDPDEAKKARDKAKSFIRRAEQSVATLELTVEPDDAVIHVDGQVRPGNGSQRAIQLDPGRHRLRIEAPGHVEQTLRISLLSGSQASTEVQLVPTATADPNTREAESQRRAEAAEAEAEGRDPEGSDAENVDRSLMAASRDKTSPDAGTVSPRIIHSPWFWVAAGVVVAGAGIGLGVGLASGGGGSDPYGGSSGVVIRP